MDENQRVTNTEEIDYNRKFIGESITDIKNGRTVFVYKRRVLDSLIMKLESLGLYYEVKRYESENCWKIEGDFENARKKASERDAKRNAKQKAKKKENKTN